jgi:hypothetical protein
MVAFAVHAAEKRENCPHSASQSSWSTPSVKHWAQFYPSCFHRLLAAGRDCLRPPKKEFGRVILPKPESKKKKIG